MVLSRIPEIDLGGTPRAELVRTFGEALETLGFVVVTNHGIPTELINDAYTVARDAFALPEAVKRGYERPETHHQMGYTPFGIEHAKDDPRPDLKEFWQLFRPVHPPCNVHPSEVPAFATTMEDLYRGLDALSVRLLELLGAHLGLRHQHFADMVRGGASMLRVLHYPPIVGTPDGMRSAPHEDINFITLLVAATASGLEIKTRDGTWIPVVNPPNAIIVNCADMLQVHTGGRMPSMTHRVVNGDGGERFSMPFFVHPRGDVQLTPDLTAGEYLAQRLREIGLTA